MLQRKVNNKIKNEIESFVTFRMKSYFNKKKPESDTYPFKTYDPYSIFKTENSGYENLHLVGDAWLDHPDSPIILVIGCNNWKMGFIADYLPNYRLAFAPRKKTNISFSFNIRKLNPKPSTVLIWGYTESSFLRKYLQMRFKNIWRIEDGFIRSADLGASHAIPYSLAIDKTGLYYNCHEPSDLENILNNYDFSSDKKLIIEAKHALQEITDLRLSKYNLPTAYRNPSIKIKKRIAILGQVDKDASIRYGNPNNWTSEQLVKLAYFENRNDEIIYRPHPEVYKGYQKSKFKRKNIESFAKISNPDENIIDFIDSVDHVYTITSLSGFEALLHGKKVTVVGAPFYSGWGLTDDRCQIERRKRNLSLINVFSAAYLLYPKYLANKKDNYIGLLSATLKIKADQLALLNNKCHDIDDDGNLACELTQTQMWPIIIYKAKHLPENKAQKIITSLPFNEIFKNSDTYFYVGFFARFMISCAPTYKIKNILLSILRNHISKEEYNSLLIDLESIIPSELLITHWSWLLREANQNLFAIDYIKNTLEKIEKLAQNKETLSDDEHIDHSTVELENNEKREAEEKNKSIEIKYLEELNSHIKMSNHSASVKTINKLILIAPNNTSIMENALEVSRSAFDFKSVQYLSLFLQSFGVLGKNKRHIISEFKNLRFIKPKRSNLISTLAKTITYAPATIEAVKLSLNIEKENINTNIYNNVFTGMLYLDNNYTIEKALAFIGIGEYNKAQNIMEKALELDTATVNHAVHYARALSYTNIEESVSFLEKLIVNYRSTLTISELLRQYIITDSYDKALDTIFNAQNNNLKIGEMSLRKCYFGKRMLKEAFETFTMIKTVQEIANHYDDKYLNLPPDTPSEPIHNLFILAIFGPGDEIRFASIYNKIAHLINAESIVIACTPRLYNIFSHSFSELQFIPCLRIRNSDPIDLSNYSNVPNSKFIDLIDNNAVENINRSDKIVFTTDLLHRVLPNYESFDGKSYLVADDILINQLKNRLPTNKKLIGLSWRSSLNTTGRNEHYLSVEQLAPIFEIDNIQFVNLQYDDCAEEIAWINKNYPGKIINFDDIDQYNDFDSVAALMMCMDLIISPATTVVELAGALGCETWLFSNSSEISWRKKNDQGMDVWHNNTTIIEGAIVGDKQSLVNALETRLVDYIKNKNQHLVAVA